MKITDAIELANSLLKEHGLTKWQIKLDKARNRFGQCRHKTKTISLSTYLIELNEESEVRDTILHEIAHALVGAGHGHSVVWKRKAAEVGARAERTYSHDNVVTPKPRYRGTCPTCKREIYRHRRRDLACGKCSGKDYNPQHKFIWDY